MRTHTKFGIKIFEVDMLMIFDPLTSHQFDPRINCYLHFVLLVIPVDLICYMTMFEKNCLTPCVPQCPKVPPLGHDPGDRIKIPSDMFCIFHLCEHTQNLV